MTVMRRAVVLATALILACEGEKVESPTAAKPGAPLVGTDVPQTEVWQGLAPGESQAFEFVATASGTARTVSFFIDVSSTCNKVIVGLYTDGAGHPDTLVTHGTMAPPIAGWNTVAIAKDAAIEKGTAYWIALLCSKSGSGVLKFPDSSKGPFSTEYHATNTLDVLPERWSSGTKKTPDGPVSAYFSQ